MNAKKLSLAENIALCGFEFDWICGNLRICRNQRSVLEVDGVIHAEGERRELSPTEEEAIVRLETAKGWRVFFIDRSEIQANIREVDSSLQHLDAVIAWLLPAGYAHRQGDIGIYCCDPPSAAQRILVRDYFNEFSGTLGRRHLIDKPASCEFFRAGDSNFVHVVEERVYLVHPEHDRVELSRGWYELVGARGQTIRTSEDFQETLTPTLPSEMRITSCDTMTLEAPLKTPFYWATGHARRRVAYLVRIRTDSGPDGWGEFREQRSLTFFEELVARTLVNRSPLDREAILCEIRLLLEKNDLPLNVVSSTVGAIEIALLDLAGRWSGKPVHSLLGPSKDEVSVYASGLYYHDGTQLPGLAEETRNLGVLGCDTIKMKIGARSIEEDISRIEEVVRELDTKTRLAVDANEVYDFGQALAMGRNLQSRGVAWFEEPLRTRDPQEYAMLTDSLQIPLAAGENLCHFSQFEKFLGLRAIRVVQPNVGAVGGPSEALRIFKLSALFRSVVAFHGWGSPVLRAATIHVAACCSLVLDDGAMVEIDCTPNPLMNLIAPNALEPRNGVIRVPSAPGLGIDLDIQAMEHFESSRR